MRPLAFVLVVPLLVACGGTPEPSAAPPAAPTATPRTAPPAPAACAEPASVLARDGEHVVRPKGSALRFQLVYQGSSIGVSVLRGVDMVLGPSDGSFEPGKNSGWWAELRSASGAKIYTTLLRDPTIVEGPGPGGTLVNATLDPCAQKILLVDVPNDPAGVALVIFGSPDSAHGAPTRELARFAIR